MDDSSRREADVPPAVMAERREERISDRIRKIAVERVTHHACIELMAARTRDEDRRQEVSSSSDVQQPLAMQPSAIRTSSGAVPPTSHEETDESLLWVARALDDGQAPPAGRTPSPQALHADREPLHSHRARSTGWSEPELLIMVPAICEVSRGDPMAGSGVSEMGRSGTRAHLADRERLLQKPTRAKAHQQQADLEPSLMILTKCCLLEEAMFQGRMGVGAVSEGRAHPAFGPSWLPAHPGRTFHFVT